VSGQKHAHFWLKNVVQCSYRRGDEDDVSREPRATGSDPQHGALACAHARGGVATSDP
jgi:hypothetical protein